ncbi:S1C family serine protease [Cyanobium sp. HWJ4-Hawea]|uniref:S1C family serine protease n=1 Tax=Cyanobium sp. HWJ4-Hawea TaxID=2823713 RepID=UPI0020CF332C|nr:S1C family serine protease [Cyanobium sp. HWJ4-Hawea]
MLGLMTGCQSRLSKQEVVEPSSPECSSQALSPEVLFEGAKPGVAVVRTGSMEGSAFVIRHTASSTYLITNSHVVGDASSVALKWSDGNQDTATVVANSGASTPQADLALLEVRGVRGRALVLKPIAPSVGADIVAIGAPQGLEFSLTRGVVSSLRENGQILQIDAPINPGNSGGPILDKSGCVVGVATFKLDNSEGLNFALSSSMIDDFLVKSIGNSGASTFFSTRSGSPSSPFSASTPPAQAGPSPSQINGSNCWFQESPGSQQLVGSLCQIAVRNFSQSRIEVQLINSNGLKRVIYLLPGNAAEVYVGGKRFNGNWLEDKDGDLRVQIEPEVFAFRSPT